MTQVKTFGSGTAALLLTLSFLTVPVDYTSAATCNGSCGQSNTADGVVSLPPDGSGYFRWVSTYGGIPGVGQLNSVYNGPSPDGMPGATNGTLYTTSPFTATAGSVLNYNFNFVTSDGQYNPGAFIYQDYAWAQLRDTANQIIATLLTARTEPSGTIIPGVGMPPIDANLYVGGIPTTVVPIIPGAPTWSPLGDPNNLAQPGSSGTCWGPGCGYTGWVNSQFTIPSDGTFVILFGVTNWGDEVYDTGLAFSGLTIGGNPIPGEGEGEDITVTPLPTALPLFATGLAALGLFGRRKRRKKTASVGSLSKTI